MSRIFKNLEYPPGSPYEPHRRQEAVVGIAGPRFTCSGLPTLFSVEGKYLLYVLTYTGWNIKATADVLGRSDKWVYERIKTHQLERP